MILKERISFIRKISLSLFIFSLLSLLGSLWLQNTLADFKFRKLNFDEKTDQSGIFKKRIVIGETADCSEKTNICYSSEDFGFFEASETLGKCFKNKFDATYKVENDILKDRKFLFLNNELKTNNEINKIKPKYRNKEIEILLKISDVEDENCIRNYKYYSFYKIFPFYFEFLYDLKKISTLGTSVSINPFINGETSISNIVKRFPINLVFKPLLFISVILMYLYWKNYNYLFKEILNSKNNKFVLFGIASAIFLFFHVLFLGMEIDNKIFKLLRKLVIVFFILSEIIAQFLLSIKLFKNKRNLRYYCNTYIINIKLLFVIVIATVSIFVIFILLMYDLSNKVDYILEWNYFAGLLFYYLLSALMWKKLTSNPSTS
tara:strand:- start:559 stop:1686 length:1128 start_codon:yes stop_codon:yes gene_type:complete